MPNHIHLIWQQNKLNGKETPKGSLLKYMGHMFLCLGSWQKPSIRFYEAGIDERVFKNIFTLLLRD